MSKIHALFHAYEKALADPNARIPTYLHAALEGARPVPGTNPYAERRCAPRDIGTHGEIGMGPGGTILRAGH